MEFYPSPGEAWTWIDECHDFNDLQQRPTQQLHYPTLMNQQNGKIHFPQYYTVQTGGYFQCGPAPRFEQCQERAMHPAPWNQVQAFTPVVDDGHTFWESSNVIPTVFGSSDLVVHAPSNGSCNGGLSEGSTTSESGYSPVHSPEVLTHDMQYSLPSMTLADPWAFEDSQLENIMPRPETDLLYPPVVHTNKDKTFVFQHSVLADQTDNIIFDDERGVRFEEPQIEDEEELPDAAQTPPQVPAPQEVQLSEVDDLVEPTHETPVLGDNYETISEVESDATVIDDENDSEWDNGNGQTIKQARSSSSVSARALRSPPKGHGPSKGVLLARRAGVSKIKRSSTTVSQLQTARRSSGPKSLKHTATFTRRASFHASPKLNRSFPCTFHHFGCQAEFPNKNEWKRHVAYQHLQLWYYRCDLDGCNPDLNTALVKPSRSGDHEDVEKTYNDFNRKDLFTQHVRRMHGPSRNPDLCSFPSHDNTAAFSSSPTTGRPSKSRKSAKYTVKLLQPTAEDEIRFESTLPQIRARCWHVRRRAPSRSNCPFDDVVFDADFYINDNDSNLTLGCTHAYEHSGEGLLNGPCERAWEQRMEHLGRHYEKDPYIDFTTEQVDEDLVKWGIENNVLYYLADGRPWLVGVAPPSVEKNVSAEVHDAGLRAQRRTRAAHRASTENTQQKTEEEETVTIEEKGDTDGEIK